MDLFHQLYSCAHVSDVISLQNAVKNLRCEHREEIRNLKKENEDLRRRVAKLENFLNAWNSN